MEEIHHESQRQTKEAKGQKDTPRTSTILDSLPREIALDILSRLPTSSLLHVKCVCHSWRRLVEDPLLAGIHFSRIPENHPCLILHNDLLPVQNHLYSLFFSCPDYTNLEMITRTRVAMFPDFIVIGSCNGLLCLWHSLYHYEGCLYNPFAQKYIDLPKAERFPTQQRVAFGFGFDSIRKVYKVVRIVYYNNGNESRDPLVRRFYSPSSEVQVLTIGNNINFNWRSKGETSYKLEGKPSQVLVNGRIHWLSYRQGYQARCILISFDLADEQFRQVPSPDEKRFGIFCTHLVNLRGSLSAVIQGYERLYIWIMKEYGVKESWINELCIGGGDQVPRELNPYGLRNYVRVPEFPLKLSQARVLWALKNGEILLEYKCKALIRYDPKSGTFKDFFYHGLPERFNAFVHISSLNWIDTPIDL